MESSTRHKLSAAGVLVAMGIIYGDIGTSPIYTLRFIVGHRTVTEELILGGLSLVFWTLTIITTIKYIYLALSADNKGEGGIFALYALVRRYKASWVIFPAIIGCCTLIADGFITPAISVTSAVEGIKTLLPAITTQTIITIVIIILVALFIFQQFGSSVVGKTFGPVMIVWFIFIGAPAPTGPPRPGVRHRGRSGRGPWLEPQHLRLQRKWQRPLLLSARQGLRRRLRGQRRVAL